ncbi:MAG: hypothetical protein ACFB6S_03695 [Geminicoccaceae bacterium]
MDKALLGAAAIATALVGLGAKAETRTEITGEVIDTWCYYSGVMGAPEATVGTAHHTCALWCAAGGIPVGILADDGSLYMVLSFEGEGAVDNEALLDVQSDKITADVTLFERDGLSYVQVHEVVENEGITVQNHNDFGPIPPFAIPGLN